MNGEEDIWEEQDRPVHFLGLFGLKENIRPKGAEKEEKKSIEISDVRGEGPYFMD